MGKTILNSRRFLAVTILFFVFLCVLNAEEIVVSQTGNNNGTGGDLVPVLTYDEISGDISVDFGEVEAPGWGRVVVQGAYGAYQVKDYWVTSTNHYFSFHCTLTGPLTITINTPGGGTYVGQT